MDDFLKTGRLGPIALRMKDSEVREFLGEPEEFSRVSRPQIARYGSLQLSYIWYPGARSRTILEAINVYYRRPEERLPERLGVEDRIGGWMPHGNATLAELKYRLAEAEIPVSGVVTSGANQYLELASSVRVFFHEGKLDSIGHTSRSDPEQRQLTVRMSWSDLGLIQEEAKARGISPVDLCSLWIKERAAALRAGSAKGET
jgi:hypothetical protein